MIPFASEEERQREFPVARSGIFLGHAGVTALPRRVADAMTAHVRAASLQQQEFAEVLAAFTQTRETCARAINARASEIALLGPTSLGLSLFANGLDWQPGDEVVCYAEDYPSNVYPWTALERLGVQPRFLEPAIPGRITPGDVQRALGARTRLVALASCHFLTGWRIDVPAIAEVVKKSGAFFSLDAIQTVGAFATDASCVDFLSADAHKWMLGPMAIGIVYVAEKNFEHCRPTLLGAWNVQSPDFITQQEIEFDKTARRYEPGVLNATGVFGMKAGLELIEEVGLENVSGAILANRDTLEDLLARQGFEFLSPRASEPLRSGILTVRHPAADPAAQFAELSRQSVHASLRTQRNGTRWLRFSPHFYNTADEMGRVADILSHTVG